MNKFLSFLAISIIPLMVGCTAYVSPDVIYKLQDDVRDVKKDVSAMKEEQEKAGVLATEAGVATPLKRGDVELELRREIASIKADMETLRGEIGRYQGFIDETKYQMRQDQVSMEEKIGEYDRRLRELEGKIDANSAMRQKPDSYEKAPEKMVPEVSEKVTPEAEEKGEVFTSEREVKLRDSESIKTPEDLYDYGLGLIKASKFREGRKTLEEFASTYSNHRLMPNVFYWRGETFYAEKDFESAAITFQEVIDRYPDSPKAPDALYKQGMCFYNMKDPTSAKAAFNLLLSKYPTSIAARKAKVKLSEIGEKEG